MVRSAQQILLLESGDPRDDMGDPKNNAFSDIILVLMRDALETIWWMTSVRDGS